jgi:hypothetical protein
MFKTRTVTVPSTDADGFAAGDVTLTIPADLPTEDRAEYLRGLFSTHVQCGQDWKGPCYANVPMSIADDVAEAMAFMGAIVDTRNLITDGTGRIALFSNGYRAHGF